MSSPDDGYQQFVISPLKECRKDLDWIVRRAQRGALTPKLLQKAIRLAGGKLRIADSYCEGLLLE